MAKKKSLQQIEDFYINQGLTGDELRRAIENDRDYQEILKAREMGLSKKFEVTKEEKRKYVLSTDQDYEILAKIHQLEKLPLSPDDKKLINFIRTQLEADWRAPIFKVLDKLLRKYQK